MNAPLVVEEVAAMLRRRYGEAGLVGRSQRLSTFGKAITCSINYSKLLRGHRFFFGLSQEAADKDFAYPETQLGGFVLLACGTPQEVLVLPRPLVLQMLGGVTSRKLDVFREGETYILQTTRHPKLNVTEFLNAYPKAALKPDGTGVRNSGLPPADRDHVKFQSALIDIGLAEGCSVWVPPNDRGLSYRGKAFSARTVSRLPNFGFDENTRRIVQNIDVLWLSKNVIQKAFEVEASTSIYSRLLRLNDLALAQPNSTIDLYIVAGRIRREKVLNQFIRPSFHCLIPKCEFFPFEEVEATLKRIETIPVETGARVTGLVSGERFTLPDNYIYPMEV
jgi:hypothetical protein